jgi:uncharacterized protein YggE
VGGTSLRSSKFRLADRAAEPRHPTAKGSSNMRLFHFLAAFTIVFMGTLASADERRIAVDGHGELTVEPDIATVEMGIFVFDKDLLKAKREADGKIAAVLAAFRDLNVKSEDVQTSQMHVKPRYEDRDNNWVLRGYEITRSITVTVRQLPQLNDVLNRAIEAGANRLEDIKLSTSKEQELKDQALTLAIENAKRRADRLAQGFGAKVGKVVMIEAQRGGDGDIRYNRLFAPGFGEEATYQPGRIQIESEVSVVLELVD